MENAVAGIIHQARHVTGRQLSGETRVSDAVHDVAGIIQWADFGVSLPTPSAEALPATLHEHST